MFSLFVFAFVEVTIGDAVTWSFFPVQLPLEKGEVARASAVSALFAKLTVLALFWELAYREILSDRNGAKVSVTLFYPVYAPHVKRVQCQKVIVDEDVPMGMYNVDLCKAVREKCAEIEQEVERLLREIAEDYVSIVYKGKWPPCP